LPRSILRRNLPERGIDLLDRWFQQHRIVYVRDMDEDEPLPAGKSEPTIGGIEVAEFESREDQREWLERPAPCFVRR
jgi:hypothetical protein